MINICAGSEYRNSHIDIVNWNNIFITILIILRTYIVGHVEGIEEGFSCLVVLSNLQIIYIEVADTPDSIDTDDRAICTLGHSDSIVLPILRYGIHTGFELVGIIGVTVYIYELYLLIILQLIIPVEKNYCTSLNKGNCISFLILIIYLLTGEIQVYSDFTAILGKVKLGRKKTNIIPFIGAIEETGKRNIVGERRYFKTIPTSLLHVVGIPL